MHRRLRNFRRSAHVPRFPASLRRPLLVSVLRALHPQVAKWVVMQAGGLSDKSKIGDISVESVATTLAVGLTL